MTFQKYLQVKKEIQGKLISLLMNEDDQNQTHFKDFIKKLDDLKIREDKNEFKSFLYLLFHISNNHHRSPTFYDTIEKIISSFTNELKSLLTNEEIFNIFENNKRFLLLLIQQKILVLDQQIVDRMITKNTYKNYFINEINSFITSDLLQQIENENKNYDIENFEEKQKIGQNDSKLCTLIREDLLDNFIKYINEQNISLDSTISKSIFETNPFLLDQHNVSLIEYAAFFGSIQIFNYLTLNKISLTSSLYLYVIHSENAEIFEKLTENKIEPADKTYNELLIESIKCHSNDIVSHLLSNYFQSKLIQEKSISSPSIKYYNYEYFPSVLSNQLALFNLCENDHFGFVEKILKNPKINVNYYINPPFWKLSSSIFSPLHIALYNKNIDIAKLLLSRPEIDVKYTCIKNNYSVVHEITTMLLGVRTNDIEIVDILLKKKDIDVNMITYKKVNEGNKTTIYENTPLIEAICNIKNNEIVKLLLSHKDIDINLTAKNYCVYNQNSNDTKELYRFSPIIEAFKNNNQEIFELLLKNPKFNVNEKYLIKTEKEEIDENLLHWAVRNDNIECVKLLLKNPNIDVNAKSILKASMKSNEETPLFLAAKEGKSEIVKILLEHPEIDVNTYSEETLYTMNQYSRYITDIDKSSQTPLYIACINGNQESFKYLIEHPKIDINKKSIILKLSRDNNTYIHKEFKNEFTVLYASVDKENEEMVTLCLANKNIDVNAKITKKPNYFEVIKENALLLAIRKKANKIAELLLNYPKIDISAQYYQNSNGKETFSSILCLAIDIGNIDISLLLLSKQNIDVNSKYIVNTRSNEEVKEMTPIFISLEKRYYQVAEKLLENPKIDLNIKYFNKNIYINSSIYINERTVIDYVINFGNPEIMQLLLSNKNIDINLETFKYRSVQNGASSLESFSPLMIAASSDKDKMFQLLADYIMENNIEVNWKELISVTHSSAIRSHINEMIQYFQI